MSKTDQVDKNEKGCQLIHGSRLICFWTYSNDYEMFRQLVRQIGIGQFQKISIFPPQKGLEFPGGWVGGGVCNAKKFKEMYEA